MSARSAARRWGWLGTVGALGLAVGAMSCQPASNGGEHEPAAAAGEKPVAFDGKRAMEYLEAVCKIGPRISGSAGMTKQQQLVEKHFKKFGMKAVYQKFPAKAKSTGRGVEMANLIISYHPERTRRVILCSHYDTRPIADQERDERKWKQPFVSANDGGSGVAFLMEMAHHMKGLKTNVGVDFVLFDGEEYIFDPDRDEYFHGSKHFAAQHKKARVRPTYAGAVLLDMIAGKGAEFPMEQNSVLYASKLVKEVWGIAKELGCDAFKHTESRTAVLDDHIPLNEARIPAIDIIDFEYAHWHKLSDVPKNCSAGPMEQVGKVLSVWLQRVK